MKDYLVTLAKIGVLKPIEIDKMLHQREANWDMIYLHFSGFSKDQLNEFICGFKGAQRLDKGYEKLSETLMAFKMICSLYLVKCNFDKKSKKFLIQQCEKKDYGSAITSIKNSQY